MLRVRVPSPAFSPDAASSCVASLRPAYSKWLESSGQSLMILACSLGVAPGCTVSCTNCWGICGGSAVAQSRTSGISPGPADRVELRLPQVEAIPHTGVAPSTGSDWTWRTASARPFVSPTLSQQPFSVSAHFRPFRATSCAHYGAGFFQHHRQVRRSLQLQSVFRRVAYFL